MKTKVNTKEKFRYAQLADHLARQIRDGVLLPGEQLPSVRMMSRTQGLSISTVSQAYYQLTALGLVEARPQSGYYVLALSQRPSDFRPQSMLSPPQLMGKATQSADLIAEVYGQYGSSPVISFSVPGIIPEQVPVLKLTKALKQAAQELPAGGVGYSNIEGDDQLRRQVARYAMHWNGVNLTEQDLVVTEGCSSALVYCLTALTKPGDTVGVESPASFTVLQLAVSLGLRVLELPTSPISGIELSDLETRLAQGNVQVCLFTPTFSNPTGSLMPEARKEQLVRLLDRYDIPLIEDDVYGETYFSKERPRPCKAFDREGRVLWCSSVSKTLAPGYRVGWVAPGRYLEQVKRVKFHHTVASPILMQRAVAIFMATGHYDLYLNRLRKTLMENQLRYMQAIRAHFPVGTRVRQPKGGFILWVELDERLDTQRLYHEAMLMRISIAPGQMFTLRERYKNCFRLSYGIPFGPQIDEALRTLGSLVKDQCDELIKTSALKAA
jgi:DNA-binding transcriptional MocR family regulator